MNITSNSPSSKLAKCPQSTADDGHRPTWSKLKLAILVKIFGHLTATDIVRAAHVCKRWRTASNVPTLWTQTAVDVRASRVTKLTTDSLVKRGVRRVNVWSDENDAKTVGVAEQISQLLSAVTDIERLDLSGCKWSLTGNSFAQSIHPLRLVALKHLNLSFMRSLSAECLNAVADSCPNVDALNLAMCLNYSWGADWPTALCRFASLRHLDLSHCSAVDSASVRLLVATSSSVAPPLETLLLDFCSRLTDDALGYIADGLPRLKHLSILFCSKLTGDAVRRLSNTSLEELHADTFVGISNAGSVLTRHIRTLEIRPGLKNSGANNEAVKVMATLSIRLKQDDTIIVYYYSQTTTMLLTARADIMQMTYMQFTVDLQTAPLSQSSCICRAIDIEPILMISIIRNNCLDNLNNNLAYNCAILKMSIGIHNLTNLCSPVMVTYRQFVLCRPMFFITPNCR